MVPCLVRVNGVQVGQQGGFEPYAEQEIPRVRRYDLAAALQPGVNELSVELVEGHAPGAVLVEAEISVRAADVRSVSSDRTWWARLDDVDAPIRVLRRQYGDPAALHLRRRAHPLPATAWLEPAGTDDVVSVVLALPHRPPAVQVQWLAFAVPPGARRLRLDVRGEVTVFVDGVERAASVAAHTSGPPVRLTVELADEPLGPRECALRIRTEPGYEQGAALAGPAVFEMGTGMIALGDWERVGLAEYSGGVRYRKQLHLANPPAAALLDLGRVRGTAEVTVNRRPAGIRVCGPYVFDVGGALRAGENAVEIVVYGTLAPYLDAVSPTHFVFPGQRVSGLFGPVRVRTPG